jgi:hypothetical protein
VAINKTDHPLNTAIAILHTQGFKKLDVFELTDKSPDPGPAGAIPMPDTGDLMLVLPPLSVSTLLLTK